MSAAAELHTPSPSAARLQALIELRSLAADPSMMDVLDADADAGRVAAACEALRAVLDETLARFAELQRDEGPAAASTLELDAFEPDAWLAPATAAPSTTRVADVCFAGGLELRRVHRELVSAQGIDEQLVACETVRRKLRRAIRAVLEAARETGEHDVLGGPHQGQHALGDLASALGVRRAYARFRAALRRPVEHTPEGVLSAVRYAGGALAQLVADPDYADVRASDRAILREIRERALAWARHDRGVVSGLNLLEDVFTCGDLLRGVNQRQELRAHDTRLIAELRASAGEDLAPWFGRFDALYGYDDVIDTLVTRARAAGPGEQRRLAAEILDRLEQLAR